MKKVAVLRFFMKNNRKPYEKLVLFPRSLSLEEQGKFMLGYYHQTQKKYEKKEDK